MSTTSCSTGERAMVSKVHICLQKDEENKKVLLLTAKHKK